MNQQDALFIFIYSTIFMSTLHVSKDRVVHYQGSIVVYSITQLCRICVNVSSCFGPKCTLLHSFVEFV